MLDVLIIGGGPAGLTAGIYAARAGFSVVLLEKLLAGGQASTTNQIENYPGFPEGIGGPELSMAMEEQAIRAGVRVEYEGVLEIDCAGKRARTAGGYMEASQLILAMGAQPRRTGAEGEERFIGRGVSYCATCDGALYRGGKVAVIGGGNSATEEALYLASIGCDVTLIHRRDTLRAEAAVVSRVLRHPKIKPMWNRQVTAFTGKEKLAALRLNEGPALKVDAAFVAIGRLPDTSLVFGQVELDRDGFIVSGEDCRTNLPGVFAVGDIRTKRLRQVVTAVADGAIAASALEKI